MITHLSVGSLGEACAASYLRDISYSIIETNVRTSFGELDIVTRDPDGTLVLVEVKTLSSPASLTPEDNLTRSKFFKLSRMATYYANKHPNLVPPSKGWRIDLISIILLSSPSPSSYKFGKNYFDVVHYSNIFL
ncbi:MAG: hypothetical protein UY31_C0041G0004 [Candidatus Wolfebacteria bacterium GW2011_GWE1_48_7]|uniref:UPF0102 protein UY19_C0003G0005 n=2 Tax=Candidatus Wolfeibacteriota TaxID=1752735 RepID=A0A0G1X7K9_9BACT|nr:MAG: hypothetical protein UX70_C0001G0223 [Candidatus Wolfebacteria bacterium GW2011_GWB1_47_1]KKU34622.1 MAG: hypothetical protein UX49_C0039G0002 [Candidatus Wolfebacteria bacterium GW2011_GWC2_46_275]KKU42024.1 MAG: hypothetical protein UX58_C0004G0083 [Candidatus Wolfebacteria bacterium GW2011_GWB2_46_69]KKU54440.1 MAG: hypothetical protein UX76_C0002G0033 [Candidatus Wolfebacteria bacterium GW2011_GWC1_47_103]KKU59767.1 MAG: hypothetical protein UX83_C0002G0054 [Candidatus Wolfebacteria